MSLDPADPTLLPVPVTVTPAASECPGCGAHVHASSATPGAKIHCLNCGARFVPGQPTTSAEPLRSNTPLQETPAPIREPRSAGYWYLRIPAMVYFAGAVITYLISASSIIYSLFPSQSRYISWESILLPMVYLPLLPLSGYFGFVVTRSLARLEAHTLKAAWNEKLIQTSLPAAKGSSLPYLLPLSVGPVVIFIVSAVAMGNDSGYRIREAAIYSGMAAVVCFILAFMIDDLRQFLWRQQSIATAVAPNSNSSKTRIAWIGLLPALTLASIAFSFVAVYYNDFERAIRYSQRRHVDRDFSIQFMTALTFLVCALTFYLTGRNFKTATTAWRSAADAQPVEHHLPVLDMAARRVHFVLQLFVLVGAGALLLEFQKYQIFVVRSHAATWLGAVMLFTWSLCLIFQKDASAQRRTVIRLDNLPFLAIAIGAIMLLPVLIMREPGKGMSDETVGFVIAYAGFFFCVTLAQLYTELRIWRRAQETFWRARQRLGDSIELPKTPKRIMIGTTILVVIEIIVFSIFLYNEFFGRPWRASRPIEWAQVAALPLILFMTHFPTLWVALVSREFLLVEEISAQARANSEPTV